jgi:hypothetical protein
MAHKQLIADVIDTLELTRLQLAQAKKLLEEQTKPSPQWICEIDDNTWTSLGLQQQTTLENLHDANVIKALYHIGSEQYLVDFTTMTLRRIEDDRIVKLKRGGIEAW